jgi:hypothetical protein
MIVRGLLTTIPDNVPVPDDTSGQIRLLSDDTLIATVSTSNGWYTYQQNGNPGPFRIFWDYANVVKNQYSKVTGPSGPVDVGNIPLIFRTNTDGVIESVGNNLAISSNGTGMTVQVATGAAMVRGVLYDQLTSGSLAIEAAGSKPRIDTVVVQVVPPGAGENIEGRSQLVVRKGAEAAVPVAPTLTQTNSLWEFPLANVEVGASAIVIASNKVIDRRTYAAAYIPTASITPDKLSRLYLQSVYDIDSSNVQDPVQKVRFDAPFTVATDTPLTNHATVDIKDLGITTAHIANAAITSAKIASDAVGNSQIANNAVGSGQIASNAVGTTQIANGAVTASKIGSNAVGSAAIADSAVGTSELANGAVTAAKIAAGAVGSPAIASGAIGTSQIADGAVNASKLAANSVGSTQIIDGGVGSAQIATNAINASHLATSSVGADAIAFSAVGFSEIAAGAVGGTSLANGAVTTAKIANGAVTAEKLAPGVGGGTTGIAADPKTPLSRFNATGVLSSGSRSLANISIGPLLAGVSYQILVYGGCDIKNNVNNGFVSFSTSIGGDTPTPQLHQSVGGVPRWAPVADRRDYTPSSTTTISANLSVAHSSGDASDIRDGFFWGIAIPTGILTGANG